MHSNTLALSQERGWKLRNSGVCKMSSKKIPLPSHGRSRADLQPACLPGPANGQGHQDGNRLGTRLARGMPRATCAARAAEGSHCLTGSMCRHGVAYTYTQPHRQPRLVLLCMIQSTLVTAATTGLLVTADHLCWFAWPPCILRGIHSAHNGPG